MKPFECNTADIYRVFKGLMYSPKFKNLTYRFSQTLDKEDIEDAQQNVAIKIFGKQKETFCSAIKRHKEYEENKNKGEENAPEKWLYRVYKNELIDLFRKKKPFDSIDDSLGSFSDDDDSSNAYQPKSNLDIALTGCATYCLEKLAQEDPIRCAIFMAKYLEYSPVEIREIIIEIAGGIRKLPNDVIEKLNRMVGIFESLQAELKKAPRKVTEEDIKEVLATAFGYTTGTIAVKLTKIVPYLRNCVNNCEEKESNQLKK
jgi:DNA-directed RNA polymerase specialized sigma24 family protein